MEYRNISQQKSSPLPLDYLRMVTEVFSSHFDAGLSAYEKIRPNSRFEARGEVTQNEVVLAVSLVTEGQLSATTVYASADFDPKASAPTVQDLLSSCVDAIGSMFGTLLVAEEPTRLEQLADESLSALENVPFDWTALETGQRRIFIKMDKANLSVDEMTDEWLKQNDPNYQKAQEEEQKATEKLFVTGPKNRQ